MNTSQLEAIVRLEASNPQDYKVLHETITQYRNELLEFTMYGSGSDTHTYAGMARSVTEVLKSLGSARNQLAKAKN
jgi:hypothetical protein